MRAESVLSARLDGILPSIWLSMKPGLSHTGPNARKSAAKKAAVAPEAVNDLFD